jgi:hypothetical protein
MHYIEVCRMLNNILILILSTYIVACLFPLWVDAEGAGHKKTYIVDLKNPHSPTKIQFESKLMDGRIILKEPILTVTEKITVIKPDGVKSQKRSKKPIKTKTIRISGDLPRPSIPFERENFAPEFMGEPTSFSIDIKLIKLNEDAILNR